MGIYRRKDSPYYWLRLEGTRIAKSTGVPVSGGSPAQDREHRRRAETIYGDAKSKHALAVAGLIPQEKPTISFRDFSRWYEDHVVVHQRGADRATSMLRQLALYFGRFADLREITHVVGREWMTWRRKQVAAATVNREFDVLKAMLREAVPKYLDAHPFAELRRLRQPETAARVLTFEEEQRLLDVCGQSDRAFILAALDTLLRLGSLLALKWEQVNLPARAIVVLNAKVSTKPKPISSRLYQALKDLPRSGPYVFAQFHGATGTTSAKNRATRRFDALCELAQVPHGRAVNGVTIHCLRHTGATRALQAGASVRTVMELGGWTLPSTVVRYLHATDRDVQAASEAIGQLRSQNVAGNVTNSAKPVTNEE